MRKSNCTVCNTTFQSSPTRLATGVSSESGVHCLDHLDPALYYLNLENTPNFASPIIASRYPLRNYGYRLVRRDMVWNKEYPFRTMLHAFRNIYRDKRLIFAMHSDEGRKTTYSIYRRKD